MTREQFATLCRAIYGDLWVSAVARDLGVNLRTAQRWASGETPIPSWMTECRELNYAASLAIERLQERIGRIMAHLNRA